MTEREGQMASTEEDLTPGRRNLMFKTVLVLTAVLVSMAMIAPGAMAFSKNSLVWKKCTDCHEPKGNKIPRIEELRTTPEEWTVIIDRMARLHGMELNTAEMDVLLKELCETQSLSPEEARRVAYLDLYNNPQNVEKAEGAEQEKMFVTCVRCHSAGKIFSYRMTESAWRKVRDFHLYMDPAIVFQMREMKWIDEADAVLAGLGKSHPYGGAWNVPKTTPAGSWMILGYEPGKGDYRGLATLKATSNGDYLVEGTLKFADGTAESFGGDATLYGGYALRTRTRHNGFNTLGAFIFSEGLLQGSHNFPAPHFRTSASTWYPMNKKEQVLKVTPAYLVRGEVTTLTLEGMNLPQVIGADLRFDSDAVEVLSARRVSPNAIVVQVAYKGAGLSQTKLSVKGLDAGSLTLAPQVDYIAVIPGLGRARVDGGKNYPAEGVQFEALAYSKGANATDPADDLVLGPVPASFKLSEEVTRPGDDDLPWVGTIEPDGTFLPTGDYGPVASREYQGEATGLVKVEAEYQRGSRHYTAEGRLVVTVPDFVPRIK